MLKSVLYGYLELNKSFAYCWLWDEEQRYKCCCFSLIFALCSCFFFMSWINAISLFPLKVNWVHDCSHLLSFVERQHSSKLSSVFQISTIPCKREMVIIVFSRHTFQNYLQNTRKWNRIISTCVTSHYIWNDNQFIFQTF